MRVHYYVPIIVCLFAFSFELILCQKLEANDKDVGLILEDIQAYGFIVGQNHAIQMCINVCPESENSITALSEIFNSKYGDGVNNIEKKYHDIVNSEKFNGEIRRSLSKIKYKNCNQCYQFINDFKQRVNGDLQSPIKEALLRNITSYMKYPEREFLDGYKKEYASSGLEEKSNGIMLSLFYPESWKAMDGRGPHILRKFVSHNGFGPVMAIVNIRKIDDLSLVCCTDEEKKEILDSMTSKDSLENEMKNVTFVDGGNVMLNNQYVAWVSYIATRENYDKKFIMKALNYNLIWKDNLISIQFLVSVIAHKSAGRDVETIFSAYSNLFELIVKSFYLKNQFLG